MEIGDALIQIADKLGTTGQHLLDVYVNAQVGIGYINIISMIVWAILTFVVCYIAYHYISDTDRDNDSCFGAILTCFVICIFLVFGILTLKDEVIRIMYPEYTGIKELIDTLSKLT